MHLLAKIIIRVEHKFAKTRVQFLMPHSVITKLTRTQTKLSQYPLSTKKKLNSEYRTVGRSKIFYIFLECDVKLTVISFFTEKTVKVQTKRCMPSLAVNCPTDIKHQQETLSRSKAQITPLLFHSTCN